MPRIRIACCALLLAGVAHAGIEKAGTTAGNFLSVGSGAAILSMGGATLGVGHDLNAAAWNPGALGALASQQYALSHSALSGTAAQDWLAAGGRIGKGRTRWALSALYEDDGTFDGRDAFGNPTGTFSASSLALGVQVAHPLGSAASAGLGVHYVNDYLGEVAGTAFGVDAGVLARFGPFGLGAAARNFGTKMTYSSGGSFDLPSVIGAGASWYDERHGVRLAVDANFPSAYYNDVRVGGEWRWQERVALRAGYRLELNAAANEPLGGPSFGVGGGANGLWVDYGFHAGNAQAQGQHRLGLTFWPGFLNRRAHPLGDAAPGDTPADATAARASAPPAVESPKSATSPANEAPTANAVAPPAPESPAPATAAPAPIVSVPAVPVAALPVPMPKAPARRAPTPEKAPPVAAVTLPAADASAQDVTPRVPAAAEGTALSPSSQVGVPNMAEPAPIPVAPPPAPVATVTPAKPAARPVVPKRAPAVAAPSPAAALPTPPAPVAVAPPRPPAVTPSPVAAPPVSDVRVASSAPRVEVVVKPLPPAPAEPRPASVSVKGKETLADIAKRWDTSVPAIMMENNLVSEKVKSGQKLKLPPPIKR